MECYIFAGSRGRDLNGRLPRNINMAVYPGRKIRKLGELAYRDLKDSTESRLVYLIPDFEDLTMRKKEITMVKGAKSRYVEVYFRREENRIPLLVKDMEYVAHELDRINCTVVFSTIAPICFQQWNSTQYNLGSTSHLRHSEKYPQMQAELNSTLESVNQEICELNARNGVLTPSLSRYFSKRNYKGQMKYSYDRLIDGIHVKEEILDKWVEYLTRHMERNLKRVKGEDSSGSEELSDDDDEDEKDEERQSKKKRYE